MRACVLRAIVKCFAAQRIAARIMAKGGFGDTAILIGFTKRKMEVEAVFIAQVRLAECRLHRGNVSIVELNRFKVGKAPPDFAKLRGKVNRLAVCGDAVTLSPDRLERMAI